MILFIALMGYLVYFTIARADTFVNSPYNQRQDAFAKKVVRGDITDRNGNVLAQTDVAEDGTETRVYPYGSLFAHVIGYSDTELGKTGLESVENFELLTSNAFFVEKIQNEFNGTEITKAQSWFWKRIRERSSPWCQSRTMIPTILLLTGRC